MKELNDCKIEGERKFFSQTEDKKTFRIESEENFICEMIDTDKCVFKNADFRKSDWLFLIPKRKGCNEKLNIPKSVAFYVELKGGASIDGASEQLFNVISRTKAAIPNFEINAKVISPKGIQPEIKTSTNFRKVRQLIGKDIDFHKVHKGNSFTHVEKI